LIHENRFTYIKEAGKNYGSGRILANKNGLPIPLACIAIKKNMDKKKQVQSGPTNTKKRGVCIFKLSFYSPYVKEHSQTMEEEVMRKHIDLYVNNFSIDLTKKAEQLLKNCMSFLEVRKQNRCSISILLNT
jgi:1,4-dihydroxy-6-naphthoate synthase